MEKDFNKKQNQKVTIFAIILSIVSIGLLVIGFFLVSSDKVVMLQSISNLSNKLENLFDNSSFLDKIATTNDIGMKANFNFTSDSISANILFDYLENKADKKSELSLKLVTNDEELLDIEGALANDNVYFYAKDITPRYYYTALEYGNILSSLKGNDYDKILALLKEAVTDEIDNDEIKKEKVKVEYNGKMKKVNKLSYAITDKTVSKIANHFIDSLKNDKELLNSIAQYVGKTTAEVENELNEFLKELTYDEVETGLYYNVYYYGFNKIIKYELTEADSKLGIEYKVEDKETINFYDENGNALIHLEIDNKKTQYDFSGFIHNVEDDIKIPFSGTLKNDTLTIVITQDDVNMKLVVTSIEDIKENNYIYQTKFVFSAETEGNETILGTLNLDLEYYFNQKVAVDLSDSVDVSLITEEDMTTIQDNLMNHPIYQLFSNLLQSMNFSL